MRVNIKESNEKATCLRLPSGLAMNRLSAAILSVWLRDKDINISGKQLHTLFRAVKDYKAAHPEWKLIEVHRPNGDTVEVLL